MKWDSVCSEITVKTARPFGDSDTRAKLIDPALFAVENRLKEKLWPYLCVPLPE